MKQFLLTLLLLLSTLATQAQQYTVYRVKGSAALVSKQKKTPLARGILVKPGDVINVSAASELKLFSPELHEMVTLEGQCAGSLASLMASQSTSRQSMTQKYFDYIMKNMAGKNDSEEQLQGGRTTAIFRDDTDSLLADFEFFPLLTPVAHLGASVGGMIEPKPQPRLSTARPPMIHFVPLYRKK